jgi:predicted lipoprotein with Yx(FWY)xxD motif
MKRLFGISAFLVGTGLALTACGQAPGYGSANTSTAPSAVATSTASPAQSPEAVGSSVGVGMSRLGQILVDSRGVTLYLFEADRGSSSVCYGSCAQNWPPLLTSGSPVASGGVSSPLLGTTARTGGTTQVTYNGHPLYLFVGDHKPGDVTGEGINAFGGGWDVLAPNGNKIEGGN